MNEASNKLQFEHALEYKELLDYINITLEESVDWILTYAKSITDFDLIETVLDLETYKQLYNESLYNIC